MSQISQDNLPVKLLSHSGPSDLVLAEMDCTEAVNEDFHIVLQTMSHDGEVDLTKLLGTEITVEVAIQKGNAILGTKRYFHGLIDQAEARGTTALEGTWGQDEVYGYVLVVRPWLHFLKKTKNSRIFEEKKIGAIVQDIFNENGKYASGRFEVSDHTTAQEYIVQDQESDYDFVHRLFQLYGFNYCYKSENGNHKLILGAKTDGLQTSTENELEFIATDPDQGRVQSFSEEVTATPGSTRTVDYNYKDPRASMEATAQSESGVKQAFKDLEVFDFPGPHLTSNDGKKLAENRRDGLTSDGIRYYGKGTATALAPGQIANLSGHPKGLDGSYIVVRCNHYIENSSTETFDGEPGINSHNYVGSYEFFPNAQPIAPSRMPDIVPQMGVTYGIVTDPADTDPEDIGRVRVSFPHISQGISRWCRVLQPWAGQNHGTLFFPRVGMEVLVGFIHGDPSFPVVLGGLYNAVDTPPNKKSDLGAELSIKALSSGVLTPSDNHMFLKDVEGSELIDINAKKDMNTHVTEKKTVTVGTDFDTKVKDNVTYTVTDGNVTETVEKGDVEVGIDKGQRTTTIEGHDTRTLESGSDQLTVKKGDQKTEIKLGDQTTEIKLGDQTTKINAGKGNVQAATKYEIKVGSSKITIEPSKITIKAMQVEIEGSMTLKTKGGIQATHEGGAMNTVKGGIVKIN